MAVLRDLSIILIAIEAFFLALAPIVLLGALIYGLGWLQRHENLPRWLKMAQAYEFLGQAYVELAMAYVVRPFLFVHSALATAQRWLGIEPSNE
ncbi:MAG: hypothetical protein JXA14_24470 [Anaerolineae bacterium]|nr:hypothetical protein [Anaerolineae bacterium]